ncbi:MAG: chemotaxis protein CheE [Phenylobacterium sp.]|nr:chemotaxis protein CheE [Phenylobacterium sp.]
MSGVTFIRVPNKLAQLTRGKGGIAVGEAVKRANAALEGLKDASVAIIDEQLAEIDRLFGPGNPDRAGLSLEVLYDQASKIIDAGGGLPGSGLEECARAVCDLVSRSRAHNTCDWDAIDVHIATLKVLRAQGQSLTAAQRRTVLKGLSDVTAKRAGDG